MLDIFQLFHNYLPIQCFCVFVAVLFFFLLVNFGHFYCYIIKLRKTFFLVCVEFTMSPLKTCFISAKVFLISGIPFLCILQISIVVLTILTCCSFMLPTFFH
jgi:hypothetical protein